MLHIHKKITSCNNCILCNNQSPLIHNNSDAKIFWVGLSAVKTESKFDMPLSGSTNSGKLLYSVESIYNSDFFYRTNLVKCLPLDGNEKIRYPFTSEMKLCVSNLTMEIDFFRPKLIFLLGKPVSDFVLKHYGVNICSLDAEFNYSTFNINNTIFVPIHHPSFILVYKRKKVDRYISNIQAIIHNSNIIESLKQAELHPIKKYSLIENKNTETRKNVSLLYVNPEYKLH